MSRLLNEHFVSAEQNQSPKQRVDCRDRLSWVIIWPLVTQGVVRAPSATAAALGAYRELRLQNTLRSTF